MTMVTSALEKSQVLGQQDVLLQDHLALAHVPLPVHLAQDILPFPLTHSYTRGKARLGSFG